MRAIFGLCVAATLSATAALAGAESGGNVPTDEQIRSGAIIDDGLDIPHIRPGTQYFEIHGSTRIARALGDGDRLPIDDAGLQQPDDDEHRATRQAAAW